MNNIYMSILRTIVMGMFIGIIIAIPIGPAGIESVRWTLLRGFKHGVLVVTGALLADAIDVMLINYGILELIERDKFIEIVFWFLSGLIIFYIGYRAVKGDKKHNHKNKNGLSKAKDLKSHAVLTGFIISFSNPLTHLSWLTLGSTIIRVWHSAGKLLYFTFTFSMLSGMFFTLCTLNFLALKGKKIGALKHSDKFTLWMAYGIAVIGAGFVLYGLYLYINIGF